jgi:hypothetical protein
MLAVGAPVLYVGPETSHVTELTLDPRWPFISVRHGETRRLVDEIRRLAATVAVRPDAPAIERTVSGFSKDMLMPQAYFRDRIVATQGHHASGEPPPGNHRRLSAVIPSPPPFSSDNRPRCNEPPLLTSPLRLSEKSVRTFHLWRSCSAAGFPAWSRPSNRLLKYPAQTSLRSLVRRLPVIRVFYLLGP